MTPDMLAAFELGSGFSVASLYLVIASLIAAGIFIWAGWILVGHYLHWVRGGGEIFWLGSAVITVLAVITVVVGFL